MKFLICGDFSPKGSGDYFGFESNELTKDMLTGKLDRALDDIKEELGSSDLNIVNVETTLALSGVGIEKNGPVLVDHPAWADYLKEQGFHVGLMANNHTGDLGPEGTVNTIRVLEKAGLKVVGAGADEESSGETLFLTADGVKVAIINACEHEYGNSHGKVAGTFHIEPFTLLRKIKEAKEKGDFVIVILHGGCEHMPVPSKRIKNLLRGLADGGADLVVNNHQHTPMGWEIYKGVPIYYGLGNFMFKAKMGGGMWNYGYSVSGELKDGKIKTEVIPYFFDGKRLDRFYGEDRAYFDKYMDMLNRFTADEEITERLWNAWTYVFGAVVSKRIATDVNFRKNSYCCESHAEVLGNYFEKYEEGNSTPDEEMIDAIEKMRNYKIVEIKK